MHETVYPTLDIARFRFRFAIVDARTSASLSSRYLGSAWRGSFGHALRQSVCVTKASTCDGCGLVETCPYPTIFESRTPTNATKLSRYPFTPNPYVLEPEALQDKVISLGIVLIGQAAKQLPVVSVALERAAETGLTERRVRATLQSRTREQIIGPSRWTDELEAPAQAIEAGRCPERVRIRLMTPLRIKAHGRFVGAKEFRFRAFAANLLRRVSLLTHFFGAHEVEADFRKILSQAAQVELNKAHLTWRDQTRFSSRQGTGMKLGGLIGEFEISLQGIEFLWPCLLIGQWTHIGKNCTFGLGRYVIEPIGKDANPSWPTPAPLQENTHNKLVSQDRSWQSG